MLIFFFVKLVFCWFILSRNLIYHDNFICETCCLWVFLRETWYMLIFVNETCYMWIIYSGNLMYLDLCLREIKFLYFFFMKLLACWFFSSWNMYIDFFYRLNRYRLLNLLRADFGLWNLIYLDIYLRETCCMLFYTFLQLNLWWYFSNCCMLVFLLELFIRET